VAKPIKRSHPFRTFLKKDPTKSRTSNRTNGVSHFGEARNVYSRKKMLELLEKKKWLETGPVLNGPREEF